jgi:hypothetical protein
VPPAIKRWQQARAPAGFRRMSLAVATLRDFLN